MCIKSISSKEHVIELKEKMNETKKVDVDQKLSLDQPSQSFSIVGAFNSISSTQQLVVLSVIMYTFFGMHNLLQEAIMEIPGFKYGIMLGYLEVLGVTICSFIERRVTAKNEIRKAPLSAYPMLTACLLASSSLANMSLNYINFPTKVVFRSCKLIPTMIIGTIMHNHIFSSKEYTAAFAICIGLILFTLADWQLTPSFQPIGLVLVSLSVVADALLPNVQERVFKMGSSRLEVTFYTNFFTLISMTVTTYFSGDLLAVFQMATQDSHLLMYVFVYTSISYVAISAYMAIVKRYGAVPAVLLATGRKAMTLMLSFVMFPKAFSIYYIIGTLLILGGILTVSLIKIQQKKSQMSEYTQVDLSSNERNHSLPSIEKDVEKAELR